MIKRSQFNSRNKMTHRHYNESKYKQGTPVTNTYNDWRATVIDDGPLQLMVTKYQNHLNNVSEIEQNPYYDPDEQSVVVQFDNEDEYYIYSDDEIEIFGKKELVYLKDILKSIDNAQLDLDGLKYLELPTITTASTNIKTAIKNIKEAITTLKSYQS